MALLLLLAPSLAPPTPPRLPRVRTRALTASLASIRAAPPSDPSLDLADALSAAPAASRALPLSAPPWRHAFRALLSHPSFLSDAWARAPFKLDERWPFAVAAFTLDDVAEDVCRLPPAFVAHGVRHAGGVYNKPMPDGFGYADVRAAMEHATVVLLNAGFLVPKLAAVSLAMLEAARLPVWLNVYLSRPGLPLSTQLHTDQQDVLLVQCTGRKRWRVYAPPPPAEAAHLDPFARGKGTDQMARREEDLLLDTVTAPGEVLYIPAGFPHETDTLAAAPDEQPSVHLTVGVDTHLWGLSYAKARELALRRKGGAAGLGCGAPVRALPAEAWALLHAPLPLGLFAAAHLRPLAAATPPPLVPPPLAAATLRAAVAAELRERMRRAEPARWADDAQLDADADVDGAVEAVLAHHARVLAEQARLYRAAAYGEAEATARARREAVAALMRGMDALDESSAALEAWADGEAEGAARGKAGFGRAAAGGGKAAKKKKR